MDPVLQIWGHHEQRCEGWTGHVKGIQKAEQSRMWVQESTTGRQVWTLIEVEMDAQAMRKSEQESETEEQYEVRWRLDKDAAKGEDRGEVDSGVRNADGDGTVGLISSGGRSL